MILPSSPQLSISRWSWCGARGITCLSPLEWSSMDFVQIADRLIDLANRAKSIQCNQLANLVFVHLVLKMFSWLEKNRLYGHESELEIAYRKSGMLTFELETQDTEGENPSQAYYDLLWICTPNGNRLCIPVPLLTTQLLAVVMKRFRVVDSLEHRRVNRMPEEGEIARLVAELVELTGDDPYTPDVWFFKPAFLEARTEREMLAFMREYQIKTGEPVEVWTR